MKKKAFLLLLLIPFVISILAFVTSTFVIRNVEQNITDITWEYKTNNAFLLSEGKKKLEAEAIFDSKYPLSEGNILIWKSENPNIARVSKERDDFYLIPVSEGETIITCSNEKKTISRSFTAVVVGDNGAVIVNPIIPFSQKTLSGTDYVGLYDTVDGYKTGKKDSYLDLDIEFYGNTLNLSSIVIENTNNIRFDPINKRIEFLNEGKADLKFINPYGTTGSASISFTLVNAINVYDYDDLISYTNKTTDSFPLVLRVNLESLENTYNFDENGKILSEKNKDTKLFGRLDENRKLLPFNDDVYYFDTTYNHEFTDKWNKAVDDGLISWDKVSIKRISGVHLTNDFYGNGFVINTHNLTYPSDEQKITVNGNISYVPLLTSSDLFRGPMPYVTLGNLTMTTNSEPPIFILWGQDNNSIYLDGDNIELVDVHFKGADFGNNLTNLSYVGTTLEINGDNNKISYSIIESGKNVIRSYSSSNLVINNTLLSNAMEFLFRSGSNKFNKVDYNKYVRYKIADGKEAIAKVSDYIKPLVTDSSVANKTYLADSLLTFSAIRGTQANEFVGIPSIDYETKEYMEGKETIIEALTNLNNIVLEDGTKNYDGDATLTNVFFYNSGISAISMDSLPQGSFLENNTTTLFKMLLNMYFDVTPNNLALTSYPTKVTLKGDCRFYDWKEVSSLTFESLVGQNIGPFIIAHGGISHALDVDINEEDYLPIKKLLLDNYEDLLVSDNKFNLPVYYMGGGSNLSDVIIDESLLEYFNNIIEIDPFEYSLGLTVEKVPDFMKSPTAIYNTMKVAMLRAASNVLGFNNYRLLTLNNKKNKWLNETPSLSDLSAK